MPDQMSIHRNPGRHHRSIPFVLVVQSNRFRDARFRVVVPLLDAAEFRVPDTDVSPHFEVQGRKVVLDPLQTAHVPAAALGVPVGSLRDDDTRVINAMDAMLSRAWR